MAYNKQTWANGDVVTATKLNHIEDGIAAGGALVVNDVNGTLDKTWQEIHDAAPLVWLANQALYCPCFMCGSDDGHYSAYFFYYDDIQGTTITLYYITDSADDYPVIES